MPHPGPGPGTGDQPRAGAALLTGMLRIWTMPTAGLSTADAARWLRLLDDGERARAARFVFERHRTTFIAAHALARCVLSRIDPSRSPELWRFVPGAHGKPVAWAPAASAPSTAGAGPDAPAFAAPPAVYSRPASPSSLSPGAAARPEAALEGSGTAYEPARLTFNLSHTDGLVGLATLLTPGQQLGFDVEPVDRTVNLDVADRFFRPEETAWLRSLPEAGRPEGFLRLWTLKEAFIKATGEGLARDLASFWFRVPEATISFVPSAGTTTADAPLPEGSPEQTADQPTEWQFEQRVVAGAYLGAVGLHRPAGSHLPATWVDVEPAMLRDGGSGLPAS